MLELQPITLTEAQEFVRLHHRHHRAPQGHKFSIAVNDGLRVVGVAIVGRPVARNFDDGWTLELTRCCTDGTRNVSSMLYGAASRAAAALGYKRLVTYTLESENGSSLKAANWKLIGLAGGGTWNRDGRPRIDTHPLQRKLLWDARLAASGLGVTPTVERYTEREEVSARTRTTGAAERTPRTRTGRNDLSRPQPGGCKHNPSGYVDDPATGEVWCFRCQPPRCISNPQLTQPGGGENESRKS